jgi:ABC-type polysaccharide/polyol phosphate transport system ATPase subunit
MTNAIIKIKNISKKFRGYHERKLSMREMFSTPFKKVVFKERVVLKDISFEINSGEFLGILGRNGSGKSTLLKLLAGVYEPDKGKVEVMGTLVPFLELGVGFNYELTARENIYLNAIILGLTKKEVDQKFNNIVEFAEIEDFLEMPLKNFSSGMAVRLAFSVAINIPSDIYLIDEVLAVGDISFQKKCIKVFQNFKKENKTIVFVSHDMEAVEKFCDRVILIDGHNIVSDGQPQKVVKMFKSIMNKSKHESMH